MLFHISCEDLDGKTLLPRVPQNGCVSAGLEDAVTPRVCFCTSIEGALGALANDSIPYGRVYNVYIPTRRLHVHWPTVYQVPDAILTGEVWCLEPVKVRKVAELTVLERADTIPSSNYWLDGKLIEVPLYNHTVRYVEGIDCILVKIEP